PLFVIVQWNAIFVLINLYRISILIQEKMNINFSPEEQELFETQFQNFSPVEFMKMLRAGTWREVNSNEILAKEGQAVSYLMLIYCGKADVVNEGKIIAELKDGDFVGEMTFSTDKAATATVVSKEPMRLLVWNKRSLKNLLTRNPSIHFAMQSILSTNLIDKLRRHA
ncbi:cyclic nucleotide-binding domain-containing protein, partial [bacterium]|nr:cyclic nucleotide-binding domain-containing protein [bacterium]MBU1917105.1 cyclic nucleotide-binding domain-containing protein [bacterium]